jgi:hypothetical protein
MNEALDFKSLSAQATHFKSLYDHTLWVADFTFAADDFCNDGCDVTALITPNQHSIWQQEHQQIHQLPDGAIWVANEAIALAKMKPNDQRNAELLALAIQATRFTNSDDKRVHSVSQLAFNRLKQLYPESVWAKKTRYYY